MSTELTVSGPDRDGVIVEMENVDRNSTTLFVGGRLIYESPRGKRLSVTLTPDEAREIASQLIAMAEQFERDRLNEQQFPSRRVGEPR